MWLILIVCIGIGMLINGLSGGLIGLVVGLGLYIISVVFSI